MRAAWSDDDGEHEMHAPVSLIVSAFAPVSDVRRHLTPQLQRIDEPSQLLLIDLGDGANRLGASCLAQVFGLHGGTAPDLAHASLLKNFFAAIQRLNDEDLLLAYHDRSDGGLLATVCEMMFAGRLGASLHLPGSGQDRLAQLFSEELGAVLQIAESHRDDVYGMTPD